MKNRVHFVGAGPGAEDLITVRGQRLLREADLVIYAGSLVNPRIMECCNDSCEKVDSSKLSLDEVIARTTEAIARGKSVVRLHTGDPALYGAIGEQMEELDMLEIEYDVTPGITSLFAAAAELKKELTLPGVSQSIVLTRTAGRTPMPENETVPNFSKTGATLAFYLSIGIIDKLMNELKEAGRTGDTPVAVVYRVGWPNQKIVTGTIDTITEKVKEAGISRQAVILVGEVLTGRGDNSLLYHSHFSHGYRNALENERFHGSIALYAFSREGVLKGEEIRTALDNATLFIPERFAELAPEAVTFGSGELAGIVASNWNSSRGHVFMGATGIAVRTIAPLLKSKAEDPAVVVAGETGKQIISLAGGHLAGANRLTRKIARITGGDPVITTATDSENLLALDELAAMHNWEVENPSAIVTFNSALLDQQKIDLLIPQDLFEKYYSSYDNLRLISSLEERESNLVAVLDHTNEIREIDGVNTLFLKRKEYVLGVGCKKGTSYETLNSSLERFCEHQNISPEQIIRLSSATAKENEEGLLELSEKRSVPISFYSSEELSEVDVPNPSAKVQSEIGTPSVSEASALLDSQGTLAVPKQKCGDHTFALAQIKTRQEGSVVVVGLGSGAPKHLTPEVAESIRNATTVAGYNKYIDFIRDRVVGKKLIESGMRGELDRCEKTLQAAQRGEQVCMVCSGDAGILAMAGLLFELQANNNSYDDIPISVNPGITAANIAAAALGAPLQNGFSLISLSDLLVPAEEVERNLRESAKSNLTCVLYNPAGKKRRHLLNRSIELFREIRGDQTLSAIVYHAGRPEEQKWIGTLGELPESEVNMSSLVVIGGDRMRLHNGKLFEERGYGDKYGR